jgi:hypothetical protein
VKLKGKKIACFLGLSHHTRFFIPLREEIKRQGGELLFVVTLSEFPYELDLKKRKLSFKFFSDYLNDEVRQKVESSTTALLDDWVTMSFKWDGFSRWPLFKQSWFFEAVVEEYYCMDRFIDAERIDMFIAHHECNRWGQTLGYLCDKKGVPFVTFQEGDYHGDFLGFLVHTHYSTASLLWGEKTKKVLAAYHCSKDKMMIIGNTHIASAIKSYTTPQSKSAILKELNIDTRKKIIVFLVDIAYGSITENEMWKEILQGLDKIEQDAVCIFKWHPSVLKIPFEQIQQVFKELFPSVVLLGSFDPYKLLAIADYCVTMGKTTLAIEALAFGKPLFSFPAITTMEDFYVQIGVAQTVYPPGNWENLFYTMAHGVPGPVKDNVQKYLEEYFFKLDGKATERAVTVIDYILNLRRTKKQGVVLNKKEYTSGRVSLIIPSGRDAEALLATLTSLSQNMTFQDWEVILVLNNDAVQGVVSGLSGDINVLHVQSDALSVLYNRGAEAASGEYFVFMRPGILYFKDEGLADGMKDSIVGIPLKNADMTPYCLGIGYDFNFTPYFIKEDLTLNAERETQNVYRDAVGGGFIAIKRDLYESTGGFDEELANHLIEPDVCLKAREIGIAVRYIDKSLGFNYKETFFGEDVSNENWKNRIKFFAKWVGKLPNSEDFLSFAGDILKV